MNKVSLICLRCGNIQISTDIMETIGNKYITLNKPMMCPKCNKNTFQIATNNVNDLRLKLEQNPSSNLDSYVIKLIKR